MMPNTHKDTAFDLILIITTVIPFIYFFIFYFERYLACGEVAKKGGFS